MELNEEQKSKILQWVEEGCSLAEIQKRINQEFSISLTFMDARLLMLDLNVQLKEKRASLLSENIDITKAPVSASSDDETPESPGELSVTIDRVKKPGALINGTVTFSDGVSASWFLDQTGRLGLGGVDQGYRPSESDLREFQEKISMMLQSQGV